MLVELGEGGYGIVTDRDLRSEVVGGRLSADDPVTSAMSTPVIGVGPDQTGADVMLTMLDHDIRHVAVFSARSEVLGVVVAIDLVAAETRSPFLLRRAIARATNRRELEAAAGELRSTVIALWRADVAPPQISEVVSAVTDALVGRVIELAIESEGPPPAEFCWMALGSHGRREPVPSSARLAWRGGTCPTRTRSRRLAAPSPRAASANTCEASRPNCRRLRASDRLADPHGVTASGEFSASSIEDWQRSIERWLAHPSDERVLIATSILLDGRIVYGPRRGLDVKEMLYEDR